MLLITAAVFISEPVADNVKTEKIGKAPLIGVVDCFAKKSQGSWSTKALAAMNFAASIVEPPPTAKTTSILCSLQSLAPSRTDSTRGFGSIPDSSKTSIPDFFNSAMTLS